MSRQSNLQKLIKNKSRLLQKLREKQALKGFNTPPDIEIEIEDLEAEIAELQAELQALGQSKAVSNPLKQVDNGKKPAMNWGKISAIAGVAAVIIAIIMVVISLVQLDKGGTATPRPTVLDNFTYQVRVETESTGNFIPNAKVIIEVGGQAPLDEFTDTNGLARIFIPATYANQPSKLIVTANGYKQHIQNINLSPDALPDVVRLASE